MVIRPLSNYATQQGLLSHGDRVLGAVSGGPDSVALLHILHGLKDQLNLHLEVAHLQHGIRGEEAKEDARFVAELAQKFKLPFHLKEIDLPRLKSKAGKGNLEALARAQRYGFFAEAVRSRNLAKVATAHTQDDQAETVLMWFLRGAGTKGLGGMSPLQQLRITGDAVSDTLTVIRPLLDVSKSEILEYLAQESLPYRVDRSNQDPVYLRNWIRSELLPKIHQRVDDGFAARLSRQAELLRDEDTYLEALAGMNLDAIHDAKDLERQALLREPRASQRRVLRLWIERARGHLRGIDFVHIDALLHLIEEGPVQGRLAIPGGWELVREYESLRLEQRSRGPKKICYDYPFKIGTTLCIHEAGIEFRSERISQSQISLKADLMEAIFDASYLTRPLRVRNFRHGDRFQPLGMTGHKKIKDLFIENRIPQSIRAKWPLLAMGEEILWIPGYGRSEAGRVEKNTGSAIYLQAIPIET